MKKKILILFTLISSLALSNTRDLKMKMVLNKEDVNQILIDIVPEDWENSKSIEAEKEIKSSEIKKVIKKKNPTKSKPIKVIKEEKLEDKKIEEKIIPTKEESKIIEDIKPILPEEKQSQIVEVAPKEVIEEKKSNMLQIAILSIIGALVLAYKIIFKKK